LKQPAKDRRKRKRHTRYRAIRQAQSPSVATEAQLAIFAKGGALRHKNVSVSTPKRHDCYEEKKNTEERIVKKAVSIQKKN
jgi:hypothetical protein